MFTIRLKSTDEGTRWVLSGQEVYVGELSFLDEEFDWDFASGKTYTLTHDSGWTITGLLCGDDRITWLEKFRATHPTFGSIEGDFSDGVQADSSEAYNHFTRNHPPYEDLLDANF